VYSLTDKLDVGFSYTSEQWYETWISHARNELGLPRTLRLDVTLPPIYSWGIAYRPTERLQLAVDLRYFDYKTTDLFGQRVVDGGLGWRSVFAVATGARYQLTDRLAMSAGYIYNDNPIPTTGTLFNVQSPAIIQHTIAVGTTFNITEAMSTSLGYAYGFRNTITGPVREARGVGVSLDSEVHMLTFSMQFKFGGCGCNKKTCAPVDYCPPTATTSQPTPTATNSIEPNQ
jgi:long-chain fatty acid transport protein